jgi:hypothetical protein
MPRLRVIFEKKVVEKMSEQVVVEADSIGLALVSAGRKVDESWDYVSYEEIHDTETA